MPISAEDNHLRPTDEAYPELPVDRFPRLGGVERPFFDYWWKHIINPRDPQKFRWLELEERAVAHCDDYANRLSEVTDLQGARVLDVGCQNGATMVALLERGSIPVGLEIVPECVTAARIRLECYGKQCEVHEGSACEMPFADGTFDAVLAANVIEHVPDKRALIRECARVLRPGGGIYLDGPNRFSPVLFVSDPHYQLFGVSVLPSSLARAYVTRVRKFPKYEAETFPTASEVYAMLLQHGIEARTARLHRGRWPMLSGLLRNFLSMFYYVGIRQ